MKEILTASGVMSVLLFGNSFAHADPAIAANWVVGAWGVSMMGLILAAVYHE